MPKLSIGIVTYRPNLAVLEHALSALRASVEGAQRAHRLETVLCLVDNSCDPELAERIGALLRRIWPTRPALRAELLVSPENVGYGRGNNRVIERLESDYHLVMNPDVYPEPEAIAQAVAALRADEEVGLLVPDVRGENGDRHFLCKRDPSLLILFVRGFGPRWLRCLLRGRLDRFEMRDRDYDREIDGVEYPTGCFMFFRSPLLRQVGGFDPRFFLYLEDADLGRRVRRVARIRYAPQVRVVHRWARGSHTSWRLRMATIKSAFVYWRKWGGVLGRRPERR